VRRSRQHGVRRHWWLAAGLVFSAAVRVALAQTAAAGGYRIVHDFGEDVPNSQLVAGAKGALYGTTRTGGANGAGTVFTVNSSGQVTNLFSFANGSHPIGALLVADNGRIYGLTVADDSARSTIYVIDSDRAVSMVYSFDRYPAGGRPAAGLIETRDGFYGVTVGEGTAGSVYRLNDDGHVTVVHAFATSGLAGANPIGPLREHADGNLYGVASAGGAHGAGGVFRLTPQGDARIVHAFNPVTEGGAPIGGLTQGADGAYYGVLGLSAKSHATGSVYRLAVDGTFAIVHDFIASEGANLVGELVPATDWSLLGNSYLYGVASAGGSDGAGTLYRFDVQTRTITVLHAFAGGSEGAFPTGGVVQSADGVLYGIAGGNAGSPGVAFRFDLGMPTSDPVIVSGDRANFAAGTAAEHIVEASGAPPITSITLTGRLPQGLTFTDNGNGTATIGGTAEVGSIGTYRVVINATNAAGRSSAQQLSLLVR
jgi:uncharacterized repeat protein (TIGR03803 family)